MPMAPIRMPRSKKKVTGSTMVASTAVVPLRFLSVGLQSICPPVNPRRESVSGSGGHAHAHVGREVQGGSKPWKIGNGGKRVIDGHGNIGVAVRARSVFHRDLIRSQRRVQGGAVGESGVGDVVVGIDPTRLLIRSQIGAKKRSIAGAV